MGFHCFYLTVIYLTVYSTTHAALVSPLREISVVYCQDYGFCRERGVCVLIGGRPRCVCYESTGVDSSCARIVPNDGLLVEKNGDECTTGIGFYVVLSILAYALGACTVALYAAFRGGYDCAAVFWWRKNARASKQETDSKI